MLLINITSFAKFKMLLAKLNHKLKKKKNLPENLFKDSLLSNNKILCSSLRTVFKTQMDAQ